MRWIIIFIALSVVCAGNLDAQVSVRLTINGFRGNMGRLLLAVYDDESQFPYEPSMEFSWPKDTLTGEKMVLDIKLPEAGSYVFSILDDNNSNGRMDKSFIGLPKERFGFSNNARPGLISPPDYEDCVLSIEPEQNEVYIHLQRFIQ